MPSMARSRGRRSKALIPNSSNDNPGRQTCCELLGVTLKNLTYRSPDLLGVRKFLLLRAEMDVLEAMVDTSKPFNPCSTP